MITTITDPEILKRLITEGTCSQCHIIVDNYNATDLWENPARIDITILVPEKKFMEILKGILNA